MKIADEIMNMIKKAKHIPFEIKNTSHFYSDLGFDSLEFMSLLVEIENIYFITFELLEISTCLKLDYLITLVEQKVKDLKHD